MSLSEGMSILLDSDDRRRHYLDYAKQMMMHFVEMRKSVYVDAITVYDAHGLTHMADVMLHFTTAHSMTLTTQTPEWRSGLKHCFSVVEASLQTLVRCQAVSQAAVIGSPIGRSTIGPASFGLGFGWSRPSS